MPVPFALLCSSTALCVSSAGLCCSDKWPVGYWVLCTVVAELLLTPAASPAWTVLGSALRTLTLGPRCVGRSAAVAGEGEAGHGTCLLHLCPEVMSLLFSSKGQKVTWPHTTS